MKCKYFVWFASAVLLISIVLISTINQYYNLLIDYNLTFDQMVVAGNYDRMSDYVTSEYFTINGKGKCLRKSYLVHFKYNISSDDVIKQLEKMRMRPAKIEELFAFGATYPDKQRQKAIIELGSVAKIRKRDSDHRFIAILYVHDSSRSLDPIWWDVVWNADRCLFLALDKERGN